MPGHNARVDDLRGRIERVEEAVAFLERAQDEAAAHALDLLRALDRLGKRLDSLDRRLADQARALTPDGAAPDTPLDSDPAPTPD